MIVWQQGEDYVLMYSNFFLFPTNQGRTRYSLLLDTVDKSTISRTIALFLSHHLIHSIDDGSGSLKYAVCDNSCNCVVQDLHSHFYCEKCHRTFCLEGTHIPVIDLPEGFTLHSINYVLKGICQECSSVGMTLAMK